MDDWIALLRLDVGHGYYADGRCRGLRFEPAAETADTLRRCGVLARSDGSSLHLHAPADTLDRLETSDGGLAWRVFATDDAFACGTDDRAERPGQLLWVGGPTPGGATDLAAEPRPLTSPDVAALLQPRDRQLPPFALLWLPIDGLLAGVSPPVPLRLRWQLAPRATVWKYCLHGNWPEPALAIVDAAGQTEFGAPAADHMDDGTPVLAIRSLGRLPLGQRPLQRLQLRSRPEPDGRSDKVLIRRLPLPAAQFLAREVIDGQPAVISEIHVHR
ncbi:hypothetical protein [Pelomonas cellulosilytica]|uniref:Uncharacterized protein n=1 Tax=Pelomonas cellulosilytica TaxID=2906762 RepID=A0ABS8XNF9_9BURK|nr:hypothetical protein [Pelomonas sp. P8]MCE4554319.1 hypothetical protein [Pelomonas sp. P8]